jgi:hypothetical protein
MLVGRRFETHPQKVVAAVRAVRLFERKGTLFAAKGGGRGSLGGERPNRPREAGCKILHVCASCMALYAAP